MAMMGVKGGLGDVAQIHAHLVIPTAKINLSEQMRPVKLIQEFINHRDRKLILHCLVIQSPEVDTKTPSPVMLPD
jgi:hypothetical protein